MRHSDLCVLSGHCSIKDGADCNNVCPAYIGVHGHNGEGGRLGSAHLPAGYRGITLANSPARTGQPEIYVNLERYVATFTRQFTKDKPIKSVYLYSFEPGTGKTTTAAALITEWIIAAFIGGLQRGLTIPERPAYFLDVNEWQTDFNAFNRPRVPESIAEPAAARFYRKQQAAATAGFAVLDDIGVRDASDAFRSELHTVINARVSGGLPTVYTSNVPMSDLATVFDRRLADRVRDLCEEFTYVGKSFRRSTRQVSQN